jgi:hypothetical protein
MVWCICMSALNGCVCAIPGKHARLLPPKVESAAIQVPVTHTCTRTLYEIL